MSKATTQTLSLVSCMRAGILTSYLVYPDLSPMFQDKIKVIDKALWDFQMSLKNTSKEIAKSRVDLNRWGQLGKHIIKDKNLTVMVATSQQCCQDLYDKLKNKQKRDEIMNIKDQLDALGVHLHEGLSDRTLIPKFQQADELLTYLYEATGFKKTEG